MIDLYYYTSPNVRKVLIALEELGLDYQIVWTDISEGDQFESEYVEINPNSKVPAIVDHDGPGGRRLAIFESGAILLYLAEKTGRLLPEDPIARQEVLCWLFWQVANQGPMAGQAAHFVSHAPKQGIDNPYARNRYAGEVARLYRVMDDRLADREYLAGEYSIADIAAFPWTRVAAGHGVDVADYPNVKAWANRISARPAAKVRISDPREEKARNHVYSAEQFKTLFRPEGSQP
ncbi:glutathione S-transferase [Rhodococcus sp. SC4]|jgi:GST-like protein|uniref:glutathione S-transferase family protein n=1 Tax=unclassified Rhodococcus (in: high G+C Gram-positive bacteria) TaxID=192944 RepID=UPI000769E0C8|nr:MULTISPECIES: glutathione S-transferase N-terminal domain-containing protein [unclassified Rhodococcus (in: high G+C Gram-positive bacteria)]KXF49858.1 glutathione S-transferase [Rhodococcus sp. SC4]KXX62731.1 glutathione S-transferase [Rhodococcus sp. LB1]PBC57751.1 glutathione S-transferase [Rhodococcus sp. ACPA1]